MKLFGENDAGRICSNYKTEDNAADADEIWREILLFNFLSHHSITLNSLTNFPKLQFLEILTYFGCCLEFIVCPGNGIVWRKWGKMTQAVFVRIFFKLTQVDDLILIFFNEFFLSRILYKEVQSFKVKIYHITPLFCHK